MVPENKLKEIVKQLIEFYASLKVTFGDENNQIIMDDKNKIYELKIIEGYFNPELITLIHLEIREELIWINHDATDEFIAFRLEDMGVPKKQIVLGYLSLEERKQTEYSHV